MLAAAERLRRRADFSATVRGGRRGSRGALVVHLMVPSGVDAGRAAFETGHQGKTEPVPADQPARAGFVVSRAVGGAVVRNLVRRRLRHLVRERITEIPAGSSLVVRALPDAARRKYAELALDLDAALAVALRPRLPRGAGGHR